MSFPENVTFPTYFALLHEIRVSNKSKSEAGFWGKVLLMTDKRNRKDAPASVRQFCNFAILRLIL